MLKYYVRNVYKASTIVSSIWCIYFILYKFCTVNRYKKVIACKVLSLGALDDLLSLRFGFQADRRAFYQLRARSISSGKSYAIKLYMGGHCVLLLLIEAFKKKMNSLKKGKAIMPNDKKCKWIQRKYWSIMSITHLSH